MEKREQVRVAAALEEILERVDVAKASLKEVREKAAEMTAVDLSSRECRKFVVNTIKKIMGESDVEKSDAEAAEEDGPGTSPKAEGDSRKRSSKKMKETEEAKEYEGVDDQDYDEDEDEDEDEEEAGGDGKKPKYEKDDEGNTIICELSAKRKVVVSRWKGKTLISIREYYEKDGKTLPSSKGISLTGEQFEILAKSANNIEAAISSLQ